VTQRILIFILATLIFSTGCSIEVAFTDKTLSSEVVDFSGPDSFDFDPNYVEVKDGTVQLKTVDLEHSGEDFLKGRVSGSTFNGNLLTPILPSSKLGKNIEDIFPDKKSSLLARWGFDGGFSADSNFNFDTTVIGGPTIFDQPKLGEHSLSLGDGASLHVTDSSLFDIGTEDFSLSVWVKASDPRGTSGVIARKGGGTTNTPGYWFSINGSSGILQLWVSNGRTYVIDGLAGTRDLRDEKWHHILWSWNRDVGNAIYVDGVLEAKDAVTDGTAITSSQNFYFAGTSTRDVLFNGNIDELTLMQSSFTPEEASELYSRQTFEGNHLSPSWTPGWDHILAYWKMDGNWFDSAGQSHGVATGQASFSGEKQVGNHSGLFDGSGDSLEISETSTFEFPTADFAIGGWFKAPSSNARTLGILSADSSDFVNVFLFTDGRFFVQTKDDTSSILTLGTAEKYKDNLWHHFMVSRDNSKDVLSIFIDGKLIRQTSDTRSGAFRFSDRFRIGMDLSSNSWNGELDEIAMWNKPLQPVDVQRIFNRQKQKYGGSYDSNVIDMGDAAANWPDLSWSTTLPFGKGLVGNSQGEVTPTTESTSAYPLVAETEADLLALLNFNENALDTSGNENNGVVFGDPRFDTKNCPFSGCLTFDGSTTQDYIQFAQPLLSTSDGLSPFSAFAWVSTSDTQSAIFSQYDGSANRFGLVYQNSVLSFFKGGIQISSSPPETHPEAWKHLGVVKDETGNFKLYINGNVVATGVDFAPFADAPFRIGALSFGSYALDKGQVDEASIWKRALSESEVVQLYRRGANRIHFQVKTCIDASCNCETFSASPAGSISDCDGDGIANTSDFDDVHRARFMGPGGDGTTFYSELFNRDIEDVVFSCDAKTSDTNPNVCAPDEIRLTGNPKATSPLFSFEDFLEGANPQPNRYFQYRVHLEADNNTACSGQPCLPELSSVNLNAGGIPRYYGLTQEVTTRNAISYINIRSATLEADACATFQLSPDKKTFYVWNGKAWAPASDDLVGSTAEDLVANAKAFGKQFGPGDLFLKALLSSDKGAPCSFTAFDIESSAQSVPSI